MKNLFYSAVNLAVDKEINGTGDLMFPLLGRRLITDRQTEAIIPLQRTLNYLSLRKILDFSKWDVLFRIFSLLSNEFSFKPSMDLVEDRKALNWLPSHTGWMLVNPSADQPRSSEGHGVEDLTTKPRSFDRAGCISIVHHPRLPASKSVTFQHPGCQLPPSCSYTKIFGSQGLRYEFIVCMNTINRR